MRIEVVCINDKHKPAEVPASRWVKENEIYHITLVERMNMQGGSYGCKLEELNNDDLFPYTHFALNRFVSLESIAPLTEALKELTRADGISTTHT